MYKVPAKANREIADKLIAKTLRTIRDSGLPYFHSDESQQRGHNFGEKLTHAIEYVLTLGYERLIILGNDTPDLNVSDIHQAVSALDDQDLVLGPSHDGGLYLIGLNGAAYKRDVFLSLPWQSQELGQALSSYVEAAGLQSISLHRRSDIDCHADLLQFFEQQLSSSAWFRFLAAYFSTPSRSFVTFRAGFESHARCCFPQRGPPQAA